MQNYLEKQYRAVEINIKESGPFVTIRKKKKYLFPRSFFIPHGNHFWFMRTASVPFIPEEKNLKSLFHSLQLYILLTKKRKPNP